MFLVSYIRPFDAKQQIYVLANDKEVEEIRLTSLEKYSNEILQLISEYQGITNLDLYGVESLCNKLKEKIIMEEATKYNSNRLIINYKGAE